jgi:hypothetical protein
VLNRSDASRAISVCNPLVRYELAEPDAAFNFVNLYPVDLRVQPLLATLEDNEVVAEFEKILDQATFPFQRKQDLWQGREGGIADSSWDHLDGPTSRQLSDGAAIRA